MASSHATSSRVRVDGKFFRLGAAKFFVKGVSYGPFQPGPDGQPFPSREDAARDMQLIVELGANVVRLYSRPPAWMLDLAEDHRLKLMIDLCLDKQRAFLGGEPAWRETLQEIKSIVREFRGHPAVFAFSVVNEIPPDIVRWTGTRTVAERIEEMIHAAKAEDPDCLCTFANFPPTEYLQPRNVDFVSFNVYLHQRPAFDSYLARLQMQAQNLPLLLSEFGIDSIRETEEAKCSMLEWQVVSAFRAGLAGVVVFSFTDDWVFAGKQVDDWAMGLTGKDRQIKKSFRVVQECFRRAPYFRLLRYPKVSVVVACYNGARTLKVCLDSLQNLHYPDYEVILVDDGSTDATADIASHYDQVRLLSQRNHGLGVARNTGIAAAKGEIVAFTDADCRSDEDWLYYLVAELLHSGFAGLGGPNLLPPEDSPVAAAVMVSPGGPAHVMLTDQVAEHIPGCNMAFYKWALNAIGGFDPIFRRAGDDVDLCWRLQQRGHQIGFSPAGFVWHYRRSTVRDYLKQQRGYGESEALLERKHPEYFNSLGGSLWRGRIYTSAKFAIVTSRSIIYHGVFGTGFFQTLYAGQPAFSLMLCTSLEYHVLITLPLVALSMPFAFLWPLTLACLAISIGVCIAAAVQADLPKTRRRFWSRPLVAWLFFLQPIVRGWARYQGRLAYHQVPGAAYATLEKARPGDLAPGVDSDAIEFWSAQPVDRVAFVTSIMEHLDRQGWTSKADAGWDNYDLEIYGNRWSRLQLTTVTEGQPEAACAVRCRLHTQWSLLAVVVFWAVLGAQLLLVGLAASKQPWVWMILLIMPLFGWFLEAEKRHLQRLIVAFLNHVASQLHLQPADPK